MDLRIFVEPQQGASYDDQLAVAKATEDLGFDAFFRSDHYVRMGAGSGDPGPTDSWTTLAGLARDTARIKLGTLVSSATFRHPGILAIQVAQVDQMSGGRVELGLGAGWFEREHAAYGIPFPAKRFGLFAEQLEVITGLWSATGTYTFHGEHYDLTDSPALPKPAHDIPIIIGGSGATKTPALAVRYAAEFNLNFPAPREVEARVKVLRAACEAAGRDPESLTLSVANVLCAGRDDAEVARRASAIGRDVNELREVGFAGTPSAIVDRIGGFRELGVRRVYLQVLDLRDLDHLAFVASEVASQL
ncbi:LLM class F420-dependent oxidoreductase [Cellulomonas sp. URHD0024]|uniref:LLM class F420-dependent oxidoreductase n=1 Tax=Cellulomonas sp. URHD0024 TaxID=1302620 RepID=UPI000489B3FE|nr:LLM class F420-dependent oxidoreductase [Cellulomonas sp. URHD0024]